MSSLSRTTQISTCSDGDDCFFSAFINVSGCMGVLEILDPSVWDDMHIDACACVARKAWISRVAGGLGRSGYGGREDMVLAGVGIPIQHRSVFK